MTNLSGIQPHEVSQVWPFVEEMFLEALEESHSRWSLEDVVHALGAGEMQLWLATSPERQIEAAMITRLLPECSIFALVGEDPGRWMHLLKIVEDWARSVGCEKVRFEGRPGWKKLLPDYRSVRVVMEKDLFNG